jgi:hypothetical protein
MTGPRLTGMDHSWSLNENTKKTGSGEKWP